MKKGIENACIYQYRRDQGKSGIRIIFLRINSVQVFRPICYNASPLARVVKLVDTRDLKSLARNGVPVRFRSRAPVPGSCMGPASKGPVFDRVFFVAWPEQNEINYLPET